MNVVALTAEYESWLGDHIPVVAADLSRKHEEMASSELRFLRGTYYLWLRRMGDLLPELLDRPAVALVGDLHVENFGTWRDGANVRRWGVNDFDELAWGSYAIDLVRLATSIVLTPDLAVSAKDAVALLLRHWRSGEPGPAIDVDGADASHLRRLTPAPVAAARFYGALADKPVADLSVVPEPIRAAVLASVASAWSGSWHTRQAGTGSLGHPRRVAVGSTTAGEPVAREVKLLGPPTTQWLAGRVNLPVVDPLLFDRAHGVLHGPDPYFRVDGFGVGDWQVRRLVPDSVRIELTGLRTHDAERVIASMAQAVLDVHGIDRVRLDAARADATELEPHWLRRAVEVMATSVRTDFQHWRSASDER